MMNDFVTAIDKTAITRLILQKFFQQDTQEMVFKRMKQQQLNEQSLYNNEHKQ